MTTHPLAHRATAAGASTRWPRILAGILAALLLLTACGDGDTTAADPDDDAEPELVTVRFSEVIHSVFYAPQYVAVSQGFFAEEGIEVESQTADGSDRGTAALIAGAADVALVGPETSVFLLNNPEGDTRVSIFAQITNTDGSFLMGHEPDPDFSWDSVRGRTIIGWRPGSMPQMVLEWVLDQNDLVPGEDVEVVTNLQIGAAAGAFTQKQGDYITVFEPTAASLSRESDAHVLTSMGEEAGPIPYTVYTATASFIEEYPDVIQRWTNAIYKAQLWMQDATPREVADAVAPHFDGANLEDLEAAMTRYLELESWPATPLMTEAGLERLQDVMVHGGVLAEADRVAYADAVDPRFAEQATAGGK